MIRNKSLYVGKSDDATDQSVVLRCSSRMFDPTNSPEPRDTSSLVLSGGCWMGREGAVCRNHAKRHNKKQTHIQPFPGSSSNLHFATWQPDDALFPLVYVSDWGN